MVQRTTALRERVKKGEMLIPAVQPKVGTDSIKTVTVACNCPNGLILRVHTWIDNPNPMGNGGKEPPKIAIVDADVPPVRLNSVSVGRGADSKSIRYIIAGGYALTPNVDKDFWERWAKENEKSPLIKNKMVYALPTTHEAEQEALKLNVTSGFEPMDPAAPPKNMNSRHIKVMPDDGM